MIDINQLEEYKFFIDDTARFSERRQTISNIYMAVNSLLLTAIGLVVKDLAIQSYWNLFLTIPLVLAGIAVSLWWSQLIYRYKELVRFRIKVLRKMEDEMTNSIKMYHLEDELYPVDANGNPIPGKGLNLSDIEGMLPKLFIILYIICFIVVLLALVSGNFCRLT
ncbi:Uncharacterised protein [uncultured archaeon]|nr:Uncharacterised protein [uncultured archaeon]